MAALRNPQGKATLPKGIGTSQEVDQANSFLREQPWYQELIAGMGQDPNSVHLSDSQRHQVLDAERQHGIGVSDRFEIDPSGNIHQKGSVGKKILIGAGIGGLALTGLGAAGIGPLAGILGGSGAAAGAGGAAAAGAGTGAAGVAGGLLPSAAIGSGMMALPAGAATSGLLGAAGTAAGLGAGAAAGGSVASKGIGSSIKDFFLGGNGKRGLDPTALVLGGLSMFGGNGAPDPYSGATTNPEATLAAALQESHGLLDKLKSRGPARLRMPDPISIEGVPFQIGGGFGRDENGMMPLLHQAQGAPQGQPGAPDQLGGNPFATAQFGGKAPVRGKWNDLLGGGGK